MNEIRIIENERTYIAKVFDSPPAGAERLYGAHTARDYDDGYYDLYYYRETDDPDFLRYAAVWREYDDDDAMLEDDEET